MPSALNNDWSYTGFIVPKEVARCFGILLEKKKYSHGCLKLSNVTLLHLSEVGMGPPNVENVVHDSNLYVTDIVLIDQKF